MSRVYNFSAGPSMMPAEVLEKAQTELLNYKGSGQSVMEMSHRSKEFTTIIKQCESNLRQLMNIPENYKVLFIQGGASLQFSMIPYNLVGKNKKIALINSGAWSKKAMKECKKITECECIASSESSNFNYIPKDYTVPNNIDYLYICENNTIYGTKYHTLPSCDVPIVADLSSCICSEPIDITKYGLVFAGAQKNLGPAGVCIVIVREDLIQEVEKTLPDMLSYKTYIDNDSLFNTPPTFAIYMMGLMLEYLLEEIGGLENMKKINEKKANLLYDFLDSSTLFSATVAKEDRSLMNIPFITGDEELDALFVKQSAQNGFINLKGHRSVGGMRASIYNAMPYEGVYQLVEFMKQFEKENKNV